MMTRLEHELWWVVLCYFVVGFVGPLFWLLLLRILRVLPGFGDDEEPVTFSVSAVMSNMGSEAPPGHWESLCFDMRRLVLSKVPLRDLAPAAATCREFRDAFHRLVGEQRERLISVAETSYGKDVAAAFVRSVQYGICRHSPFKNPTEAGHYLVVGAGRGLTLVPHTAVDKLLQDGCVAVYAGRNRFFGKHILMTNHKNNGQFEMVKIGLCTNGTCRMHMEASVTQGTGEAELGTLLAICTRNQEAWPSHPRWHVPSGARKNFAHRSQESPKTIRAIIQGPKLGKNFEGRLEKLSDTFFVYTL